MREVTALERAEAIADKLLRTQFTRTWLVDEIHRAIIEHSNAELELKREAPAEVDRLRAEIRRWNVAMSRFAAGSEFVDEPEKMAEQIAKSIAFAEELGRTKGKKDLERLFGPICKHCGVPEKQCDCLPTEEPGACS